MGNNQSYLGYSIVILKRDCEHISELLDNEWEEFKQITKVLEKGFKKTFGARMFNWTCLMNDAYKAENPKPLVHWHLRPRYDKNVEFGNLIFEDPNFGHHYDKYRKNILSNEILEKIGDKIKENIK